MTEVRQAASHAHLTQSVFELPGTRSAPLDAIIVPASRPADQLLPIIELSAALGCFLVVLGSHKLHATLVAQHAIWKSGANVLLVDIPAGWDHLMFPKATSAPPFRKASFNRESDLSKKRMIGLMLAKLSGWSKIVFWDDDVALPQANSFIRIAEGLEDRQMVGMLMRHYPDNSVVCHARRLAGMEQDVFVTGAVMGVRCDSEIPLPMFPDIYNEDWFFFATEAAAHRVSQVGEVEQATYSPFINKDRARYEEFGDLLAEGLYALIDQGGPDTPLSEYLSRATRSYWSQFIEARFDMIGEVKKAIVETLEFTDLSKQGALVSLKAAQSHLYYFITSDLCVDFIEAWQQDLAEWHRDLATLKTVGSIRESMDFLGLKSWIDLEVS